MLVSRLMLLTVLLLTLLDWGVLPRGLALDDGGGLRGKVANMLVLGDVAVEFGSDVAGGGSWLSRLMAAASDEWAVLCTDEGSEREAVAGSGRGGSV